MAKSIALNRVPGESDIGHQRDVADIAQIEVQRDVVPGEAALLLPAQNRRRGQLRAIVADHHRRPAAPSDQPIQLASDAMA
jgi:hypothetical protein